MDGRRSTLPRLWRAGAVAGTLLLVGSLPAAIPAIGATRVDPTVALRSD